jgi:UDP-N-acetylglucosamine 2-epimerase (non-hydrolysing)
MNIDLIVGARPNFMKISPIVDSLIRYQQLGHNFKFRIVHTGQHFDSSMSDTFFSDLGIPKPDVNLGAGGGTHAQQTANIMVGYESLLFTSKVDLCLVVGDVTSTMACAIVAKKLHIKVAHVEAGIRSYDITMPEEINRLVTDAITDYFFTTSTIATQNLLNSGVDSEKIHFVGNTMIDTLLKHKNKFQRPEIWEKANLESKNYFIVTLHRPSNVDNLELLNSYLSNIVIAAKNLPIIFPLHPRTSNVLKKLNLNYPNLFLINPLGYLEFNYLVENSKAVITDSGGITEETTVLGIPCMTIRDNTERPETVTEGTNELIGTNPKSIIAAISRVFDGNWKKGSIPEKWDGKSASRIVEILSKLS